MFPSDPLQLYNLMHEGTHDCKVFAGVRIFFSFVDQVLFVFLKNCEHVLGSKLVSYFL